MKGLAIALCLLLLPGDSAFAESSQRPGMRYSGAARVLLVLFPEQAPEPGHPVRVAAQLSINGKPLTEDQLKTAHAGKLHLLVIDPTFTDYQHLHPEPEGTPGSYVFTFTPKLKGGYRVWADITLADSGNQQFVSANLGEPESPAIDAKITHDVTVKGYRFSLSFDETLRAGGEVMGTLHVADARGNPVEKLEPIMGAFAHIVGFYDDYKTVVHAHPVGKEPRRDVERGGPSLLFYFMPGKTGFIRLFAQVRIDGEDLYVPFGIKVEKSL